MSWHLAFTQADVRRLNAAHARLRWCRRVLRGARTGRYGYLGRVMRARESIRAHYPFAGKFRTRRPWRDPAEDDRRIAELRARMAR